MSLNRTPPAWAGRRRHGGVALVICRTILDRRRFGRELHASGGNQQAAIASGIDADARMRQVYVLRPAVVAAVAQKAS